MLDAVSITFTRKLRIDQGRVGPHSGRMRPADRQNLSATFRAPVLLGEDDTGAAMICSLLVMKGLTFLDINPAADLDCRLAAAQMVFGLSARQMALAARIASGESLTDAGSSRTSSLTRADLCAQ